MDLQGNPIPSGSRSTKVKTAPETYNRPVHEPSGPVTNDSLAAESIRSGGGYSQNRGAEPLGVSGNQSTVNNTDTSSATMLRSAPDSTNREDRDRQDKYPEALGGQADYPGAHLPESGYVGGSTQAKRDLGINTNEYPASQKVSQQESGGAAASGSGYRSQYNAGTAPSYVTPVTQNLGNTKANGTNITEGGFDYSDRNNASFNSDIGSNMDPGRVAENKFQRVNMESGPDAAVPNRQKGVDNKHWYQPLERDQRA